MGLKVETVLLGKEQLDKSLQDVSTSVPRFLAEEFSDWAEGIVDVMSEYPPESEANQPPPPYYIRGTGYVGRSGKVTKRSENLFSRWFTATDIDDEEVDVSILNLASYSAWVHGAQLQTAFHARRGWKRLTDVVSESAGPGLSIRSKATNILNRIKGLFR